MTKRDDGVSLRDMMEHAEEAVSLCSGKSFDEFRSDRVLVLATERLIEILGEAANRISSERKEIHPEIPWRDIVGMRNKVSHGYDIVEERYLWETVKADLPQLILQLRNILKP